ncbi:MAG: DHH family phosphoesterase [Candidatus Brocadiia bacterium]
MPDPTTYTTIWEALTEGSPVLVTSHERLDGDGIGSALALWHALQHAGVEALPVFQPPTPSMFDFLPGVEHNCAGTDRIPEAYNLVVIDCGNLARVGEVAGELTDHTRLINIDHHDSNTMFGDLNCVDPSASSCGEMVWHLLQVAGTPLTGEIAECIFTAIVSDTGQFAHQDTTPRAFRVCAQCVEAGARPHTLVRKLFMSPSPDQVRLRHLALGTLQFHCRGAVATMEVTEEMFNRTKLAPVDTEGFAEIPIAIRGVQASALLKEMPGCDFVKVSMRSGEQVDVCAVARAFGGGGHKHAAGCEIADTLPVARDAVVQELAGQIRVATH